VPDAPAQRFPHQGEAARNGRSLHSRSLIGGMVSQPSPARNLTQHGERIDAIVDS